ncbi:MAG TPA: ATP-binding protein [Pseudolabrys sp.]|nr:ATP-binding protein [Pseudolabrys sp.]
MGKRVDHMAPRLIVRLEIFCTTVIDSAMRMFRRYLVIVLAAGCFPAPCLADPLPRSLLVLNEGSAGIQGYADTTAAFRTKLNAGQSEPFNIYIENLDLNLFQGVQYQKILLAYLRDKYSERPIGIIVANGTEALKIALQLRADQGWGEIAILFAAVDEGRARSLMPLSNVTGRFLKFSLEPSIEIARLLVKDLKQIVLVGDPLDRQPFRSHFAGELPSLAANLGVTDLSGLPMSEIQKRVATLPERSAIFYTTLTTDGAGRQYSPNQALRIIARAANRPIVVDIDNRVGNGAMGGFVVLTKLMGEETATLALQLFNGENISNLPVSRSSALKPVFDWRELQRWKIAESDLPEGSEIRFRPRTAWEQYRWQIVFIIAIVLTQGLSILGLLYEHRRRRVAEAESLRRMSELAHLNRIATAGTLSASIAHEVRQPLAAMVAQSGAAMRWLGHKKPNIGEVRDALQKIIAAGNRASQIIENLRSMFRKGRSAQQPVNLNILIGNVLALTATEIRRHGISLETVFSSSPPQAFGDPAQLEQVFLNLITNAIEALKSSASEKRMIRIETATSKGDVLVSVADSGPGISAAELDTIFEAFFTTKPEGMGMGLSICRSIVETHGGRLWATRGHPGLVFHLLLPADSR